MSWKRILTLVGVTAAVGAIVAASTLAATGGGSNTLAQADELINGPVVQSDEGIEPNDPSTLEVPIVGSGDEGENSESMSQTELTLTNQDRAAIIRLSLERALVAKEIPDYDLWHAGKDSVVLSPENLDDVLVPTELPNVDLIILGPDDIQIKADAEGNFMYLRFGKLKVGDAEVQVDLGNWWAVGKDSKVQNLSGGFFTLAYQKVSGEWVGTVLAVALS